MSNMTGLGKYQKGLELEKEGLSAKEIAGRIGLKDAQAWYAMKNYYSKRNAAFNARAAGEEAPPAAAEVVPVDGAIAAQLLAATEALSKPGGYVNDPVDEPATPKLKMEIQITAEGKALRYRLNNTHLIINKHNARHNNLVLNIEEALTMLEEIKELLKA